MKCPFCKKEIPDHTQFCPECGQSVNSAKSTGGASADYWNSVGKEAERDNKIHIDAENRIQKKKRAKKHAVISVFICIVAVVIVICYFTFIRTEQRYQSAVELFESGQYQEALEIFNSLGSYKDSLERITVYNDSIRQEEYQEEYQEAVSLYNEGKYDEALLLFEEFPDYLESSGYIVECQVQIMQKINPVYEWSFDENLSEINGTESTVHGDTSIIDLDGVSVAAFDGDGDYISCGNNLNMSDDFTFHTVIYCQDIYKDYSAFFAKYETNGEGPYAFSINQGYVNCWVTDADGYHIEIESETKLENNRWYCVSIVRSGTTISLYIDGVLENQDSIDTVMQNADTVTIGRQALMFEPVEQLQFTGYIESIKIYDSAFDSDQVAMLTNIS